MNADQLNVQEIWRYSDAFRRHLGAEDWEDNLKTSGASRLSLLSKAVSVPTYFSLHCRIMQLQRCHRRFGTNPELALRVRRTRCSPFRY